MEEVRQRGKIYLPLLVILALLAVASAWMAAIPVSGAAVEQPQSPLGVGHSVTSEFCQPTMAVIADGAPASPYPSTLLVSGLGGVIADVTVQMTVTHGLTADIDMLLVSPTNQNVILMSDAGNGEALGVALTFSDAAAASLPSNAPISPGIYSPTNHAASGPDSFPAPAPTAPHGSALSVFDGGNPNGAWGLYIVDDTSNSLIGFIDGWCLTITAGGPTATPIMPTPAPSHGPTSPTPTRTPTRTPTPTATPEPRQYLPMTLAHRCLEQEIEPNNTRAAAIASGNTPCWESPVKGVMASAADNRDVYYLDIHAPTGIRIVLDQIGAGADFDLALYDPSNNAITVSANRGWVDEIITISSPLPPGRYVIMAYSHLGYSNQLYRLHVRQP